MKTSANTLIISILINYFATAQVQSLDGTYKTSGSEAGRTVLTISDNASTFHVSYIDANYQSFSLNGSLQNPATNFYQSNETLGCGSPTERSQKAVEITFVRKKLGKEVKLDYKYCDGNTIKRVAKTFIIQNNN